MSNLPARRPEDELIDHVVNHVRLGDTKRDEALDHYRQAGEGLLQLKLLVGHEPGGFKAAVSRIRDTVGRQHAYKLMKLANEWPVDWDRWQEICGNKKPTTPKPRATPPPDPDDLEHARKLAAMRDRGGTENERAVASEKLTRFASTFDLTPDVLETKAKEAEASADQHHTHQRTDTHDDRRPDLHDFDRAYRVWLQRVRRNAASLDRETLIDIVARLHASLEIRGHDPVGDAPSWERG